MPRANRHYIPGYIWHITHRCHKREFLLKFARDRRRWMAWLFETRKRYGLSILNYIVTSNHVHLLVQAMATEMLYLNRSNSWRERQGRNTIRERNAREHSGKIGIMQQQLSVLFTWLDA